MAVIPNSSGNLNQSGLVIASKPDTKTQLKITPSEIKNLAWSPYGHKE